MRDVVVDGPDLTLKTPTAFSCGFMHDPVDLSTGRKRRHLFGFGGFGHAGAAGSHAYADPEYGLSFGYSHEPHGPERAARRENPEPHQCGNEGNP